MSPDPPKRPQLLATALCCPGCGSGSVRPTQAGYFVNTLLLLCSGCAAVSNFQGPEVRETPTVKSACNHIAKR